MNSNIDILILGGGMTGLSLAHQALERCSDLSIMIVDKEPELGLHSSGRNSGVLHAGIYYPPNSLKAKVCVSGAKRLKNWCIKEGIEVLQCGKVITPQKEALDKSIDFLYERGKENGAKVKIIDSKEFERLVPNGRTSTGRALWSPNTCVVKPIKVINKLTKNLQDKNVNFSFEKVISFDNCSKREIKLLDKNGNEEFVSYKHLFNLTGLQADRIGKKFGVGNYLTILPFKGIYWQLKEDAPFCFKTNLYPVPDLKVPFLGVHITPSPDGSVTLGPTAIPAWGRENYRGFDNIEPLMALGFCKELISQWLRNSDGFRGYARDQAFQGLKPVFLKAAKLLIPKLQSKHLVLSEKVGIRSQLYNYKEGKLIDDFFLEEADSSTHLLNAISPAFTASFSLADLILERSKFDLN